MTTDKNWSPAWMKFFKILHTQIEKNAVDKSKVREWTKDIADLLKP